MPITPLDLPDKRRGFGWMTVLLFCSIATTMADGSTSAKRLAVVFVLYQTWIRLTSASSSEAAGGGCHGHDPENMTRYEVAYWNFCHVQMPLLICMWLAVACYAKIIFHMLPKVTEYIPESALLICVGLIVGGLLYLTNSLVERQLDTDVFYLDADIFFLYMLPPIVFEAGYFMPRRAFFDNLGSILVFAVIGTLWNTFAIGFSLYGLGQLWPDLFSMDSQGFQLTHILLFAAIVSAVDPVAVLVVFDEVNVNETLHISVFGESLLNDAVTVVLYRMFEGFVTIGSNAPPVLTIDVFAGVASFFVISFGGIAVGLAFAILTAFSTKWAGAQRMQVVEPLLCLLLPYCSTLVAGMLSLSEILAVVTCGLLMRTYTKENISFKSNVTVNRCIQMLSGIAETIVFFMLGLSVMNATYPLAWDLWFIVFTCVFCLVYRFIGVFVLCAILNRFRTNKYSFYEQIIMAYGGLRGAVAYGLAVSMPDNDSLRKEYYMAAVIVLILFTVFIQGITMKPLVQLLDIKTKGEDDQKLHELLNERLLDHALSGIEQIIGHRTGQHRLRNWFEHVNAVHLKRWLSNAGQTNADMRIVRAARHQVTEEAIQSAHRNIRRKVTMLDKDRVVRVQTAPAAPLPAIPDIEIGGVANPSFEVDPQPEPSGTTAALFANSKRTRSASMITPECPLDPALRPRFTSKHSVGSAGAAVRAGPAGSTGSAPPLSMHQIKTILLNSDSNLPSRAESLIRHSRHVHGDDE